MSAKDILMKAVQCDQAGRILEAQSNYQEGIQILMDLVEDETDVAKKKVFYERIKEYIDRAEQIKLKVQRHVSQGELVAHIPIDENSTGNSYKSLFGKYVNSEVKEVLLEEPYLVERYQRENLISFLELLLKKSKQLSYILLITNRLPQNSLDVIIQDLSLMNIQFEIKYEEKLHDRKIVLMNGYVIKIGRGLHFFKNSFFSIGYHDFDFRKCLQTEVDILHIRNFQLMNGYVIKIDHGLHFFKNSSFSIGYHDFDLRKCLQTEFQNLIGFFELLVKNCSHLKYIRVVTKPDPKNPAGQLSVFEQMKADLSKRNITLTIKFEDSLHDRKIVLSSGFIVKIGRGLNFYKANNPFYSLGLIDYDFRRCLQTDVDIWRCKNF